MKKKDGTLRLYSISIELNVTTIDDGQPLPNMKELMDTIAGAKFYSS